MIGTTAGSSGKVEEVRGQSSQFLKLDDKHPLFDRSGYGAHEFRAVCFFLNRVTYFLKGYGNIVLLL